MKELIYKNSPNFIQNLIVTIFNFIVYKDRYGGNYKKYLQLFLDNSTLTRKELDSIQEKRFLLFVERAKENSKFYKELYKNSVLPQKISEIQKLPIVSKEMLRKEIFNVYTIAKKEAVVSKTGGTTGKSLEVFFTKDNMQERFAMLDNFRGKTGYKLGKKTAWFSGKNILTQRDIIKRRFWKTDYYHKVRYYSTFHIKEEYLVYYINNLIAYKPEYIVGFPSTILEVAKLGIKQNIDFPSNQIKAIFPTAESVTKDMRTMIEIFFKAKVYDQYASSEGAPFIVECEKGRLHLELQSGVFEVLDDKNQPAQKGRLILTSFTTEGTPLIRYDIGDALELSNETTCSCGNNNPLVAQILGRVDDYLYSPENGKINLGNISNTLKDVKGIVKFQAIQNELNTVEVIIIIDDKEYNKSYEQKFYQNWRDRMGEKMDIKISYVDEIPSEKSGKYRIIKNNIKHLL